MIHWTVLQTDRLSSASSFYPKSFWIARRALHGESLELHLSHTSHEKSTLDSTLRSTRRSWAAEQPSLSGDGEQRSLSRLLRWAATAMERRPAEMASPQCLLPPRKELGGYSGWMRTVHTFSSTSRLWKRRIQCPCDNPWAAFGPNQVRSSLVNEHIVTTSHLFIKRHLEPAGWILCVQIRISYLQLLARLAEYNVLVFVIQFL